MPADSLRPRPLGSSGMTVSAMSLGSWRTFERLPPETGAAILAAARDEGINFFDDARYNDETGRAPLPTGYSEVLFGELFRSAGVRREEVVVANKLWWEFWPEQSVGSLGTTAAALALAFPFTNPGLTSVLFGATSPEQLRANCAAAGLLDRLSPGDIARLRQIGA